jgi:hypothetical protein
LRFLRPVLACFLTSLAWAQPAAAPGASAPSEPPALDPSASTPADRGQEEPEPNAGAAAAPAAAKKKPAEDPYLTNWKKFEHRDERAPGRGPMGRKIGIGAGLGRPFSVGGKIYFTQTVGFQADLGTTYSWAGPEVSLQAHVVWHPYTFFANDNLKLSAYVGGGGRFGFWPLVPLGIPAGVPVCNQPTVLSTTELPTITGCQRPALMWLPNGNYFPGTLGIQPVAGLDLQFQKLPLELYAQVMPTLDVFPALSGDLGLQLGARWYFF